MCYVGLSANSWEIGTKIEVEPEKRRKIESMFGTGLLIDIALIRSNERFKSNNGIDLSIGLNAGPS